MSAAPIPPLEGTALQRTARELARQHGSLSRAKRGGSFVDLRPVSDTVDAAHDSWVVSPPQDAGARKAAEWLLDNEFLVRRALRQVTTEFPAGFQQRLPRLPDGTPRLLVVARSITRETSLDLDAPTLRSFVDAYQGESAFSIAELWAMPAVLRSCVLELLHGFLAALLPGLEPRTDGVDVEPSLGVERCVRTLRLLEELDWKAFFARASRVEATLRTDPTDVYGRMDFATRDVYRRIVEKIAWRTGSDEDAVARAAIALARDARLDPRRGHVGYWLVGDGHAELERRTGYRPSVLGRARRRLLRHPTLIYPGSIVLGVAAMLVALGAWLHAHDAGPASLVIWLFVASIPASSVATALVQRVVAAIVRPHALPKLDLTAGIPADCRTVVAIPALLGSEQEVASLVRRLETHYLANPDPGLSFVLLTDDPDGKGTQKPASLFDIAEREIARLNAAYGRDGAGPFHLVHRDPVWNPVERKFMGWERKRGKLDELNRMLRGQPTTSHLRHVGDRGGLERIRYVITLDADTQLPMGAAQRLVGLLAHPLNRAVFGEGGRVTAGYTVAQPRVETSPASCHSTWFARFFAGDTVFDVYTHAVSDTYQDLFGAGIYVGKGIYEIDTFMRSLQGRVPENWIASHDLFEGIHGRAALATDIVLYEDFPTSYVAFARRNHRWIRGDWQLLPWLWPRAPGAGGGRLPNRLRIEDRWKIADNLRRSLVAPAMFVLLVACAFGRFGHPVGMTGALVLAIVAVPQLVATASRRELLVRSAMRLALMPHDAWVALDAMARAFVRMTFTRRNLLQWTTAAHVEATERVNERLAAWKEMAPGPIAAVLALGFIAALVHPRSLAAIAPLAIAWALAPELARWSRRPIERKPHESLRAKEVRELRLLARRTWHFFEAYVGPHDQFLPPDNVQHEPRELVAHRTSPTNIGLYLVSVLSAFDLGFVGILELPLLLKNTLDAIARLERYGGHLLNWYDTRTLEPLLPRYVSTVDSGNLAGCLLVLKQACLDAAEGPAWRRERWDGFRDVTELLRDAAEGLHLPRDSGRARVRELMDKLASVVASPPDAGQERERLQQIEAILADLDGVLLGLIASLGQRLDVAALHELRVWLDAVHRHARDARRQMQTLAPWNELLAMPGAPAGAELGAIGFGPVPRLPDLPARCDAARAALGTLGAFSSPEQSEWLDRMRESLASAAEAARGLRDELLELAARAEAEIDRMDFRFLFDRERKLFHIGYDVTADRLDPNHYDLLASEARLASFLAIVKKDVPEAHWYALGRPLRRVEGRPALLSWGGTMFEYLMPALFMRSHASALLATSCEAAVDAQVAFAGEHHVPWGVSECAYAHVDAHGSYQYRSFGVPIVALKRSLDDELIAAPYASMLALRVRPDAVMENVGQLEKLGMLGLDGLYEAVDFQRRPDERPFAVVRTYMAHHQGMSLVAIANVLKDDVHVRRFHADPLVASGEILLDEGIAGGTPVESEIAAPHRLAPERAEEAALPTWAVAAEQGPSAWVLGNGHLSSMVTAACGGGLRWRDIDVTRWEPDPAGETCGFGLHARDEESGRVWYVAPVSGGAVRVVFAAHKAELLSRREGIAIRTEIAVAPTDDVEIRLVTVHNESNRPRRITLTSSAEPVLESGGSALRHPAFSKLFIESDVLPDGGLVFSRRAREPSELRAAVVHRVVTEANASFVGYESERAAFVGRHRDARRPAALDKAGPLRGRSGCVLDPVMALMARLELRPRAQVTVAFVTTVAPTRDAAIALSRRYGSLHAARWAIRDAEPACRRRVQKAGLDPSALPTAQHIVSSLVYGGRGARAPEKVLATARPCKSRLWGHGISGDDPILLLRSTAAASAQVLEVLSIQQYLRRCGYRFDVVLLDEGPSGYMGEGADAVRRLLQEAGALDWLNRRGGVFVLAVDQLDEEARLRLEATARVWLDSKDGPLADQLARHPGGPPPLPRFAPNVPVEPSPGGRMPACPELVFDNGIGGFTKDAHEYVVRATRASRTPMPWCNVLANAEVGCLVSESALGCTWSVNAGEHRLTPWRNDPLGDTPSEVLYLRDEESAEVWSTTPLPAGPPEGTLVRHGAGYTIFANEHQGLVQELAVFVAPDAPVKIARLRLSNRTNRHRRLTATYYAEWVLGTRREEHRSHVRCVHDAGLGCLLASSSWEAEFDGRVAFLASDRPTHGFTCDREEFLGRGGYEAPDALGRWGLSGTTAAGVDPCAALQTHLELGPGESLETHFVLGDAEGRDEALAFARRYRERRVAEEAWAGVEKYWDGVLGAVRVSTPDPALDAMLNRWLLYQALASRILGRTGFYQSSGAFGFRDQLQDVLALIHADPGRVRAHLLEAASHQFEHGDVLHWWHPPSGRGVRTRCSDDMLWLPYVASEYALATGDFGVFDERVPFLTGEPLHRDEHDHYGHFQRGATGPLFDHCVRALEAGFTQGPRGLPLMKGGDWNDGMNRVGAAGMGESVWLGWFVHATVMRFAEVCDRRGLRPDAQQWRERAQRLARAIESKAWDGAWYVRAFDDHGSPLGSSSSRTCRIDSIAQSWAAISGAADEQCTRQALRAADEFLVREQDGVVLLLAPPFDGTEADPGYIRAYPPGVRENGGQYTHAATWLGWAHAELGDADGAERILRLINPVFHGSSAKDVARYLVEPYALAGDVYGASPYVGRGGWSWYTGSAAWAWRLGVERILGLRREGGALRIDPCIPHAWDGFEAWVRVGERVVHVVVTNPDHVSRGVAEATIDGAPADASRVLVAANSAAREVHVRLGRARATRDEGLRAAI